MLFVIQVSDLIEIPSTAKKNRLILHRYPGWKTKWHGLSRQ